LLREGDYRPLTDEERVRIGRILELKASEDEAEQALADLLLSLDEATAPLLESDALEGLGGGEKGTEGGGEGEGGENGGGDADLNADGDGDGDTVDADSNAEGHGLQGKEEGGGGKDPNGRGTAEAGHDTGRGGRGTGRGGDGSVGKKRTPGARSDGTGGNDAEERRGSRRTGGNGNSPPVDAPPTPNVSPDAPPADGLPESPPNGYRPPLPGTRPGGTDPFGDPQGVIDGAAGDRNGASGQDGRPGNGEGGNGQADEQGGGATPPQREHDALDTLVDIASYVTLDKFFGGEEEGGGDPNGIPGGMGLFDLNLGRWGQVAYVGLALVDLVMTVVSLGETKAMMIGAKQALRQGVRQLRRLAPLAKQAIKEAGEALIRGGRNLFDSATGLFRRGGPTRSFVGDAGLFMNRVDGAKRAIGDAILADSSNRIVVPLSVLRELNLHRIFSRGQVGRSARDQVRRVLGSRASIRIARNPALPSGFESLLSKKFGLSDLQMMMTAQGRGLDVVTANNKLVNQVKSHAGRFDLLGNVGVHVLDDTIKAASDLAHLIP
jgi:hypothetical protein